MYRIETKVLKYNYRKTYPKAEHLTSNNTLRYFFFFLKIFLRALKLNLIPIFIDEAGFTNKNSNFYSWRLKGQEI